VAPLQPGHVLSGKHKILRSLGTGGWGTVYLAESIPLNLQVAIKQLKQRTDLEDYDQVCQLFAQEACIGFRLTHPNIVRVYELMQDDYDRYLIMEYAEKGTLADHLEAISPLPVEDALDVSIAICQALDYAHNHSIVHGDVRPSNILLVVDRDTTGEHVIYKLADFGFAVNMRQENLSEMAKESDNLRPLGAWTYTSPERLKREPFDGHADIYSLGAVFYEMLTGAPPFPLKNHSRDAVNQVIRCHLEEMPESVRQKRSGVCFEINQTVLKMLKKKPTDRYENAAQLLAALHTAREAQERWKKDLQGRYQEAIELFDKGEWQTAIEGFEELLADNAPYNDLRQRLDEAKRQIMLAKTFETAMGQMKEKNWKEAIQRWDEILSQDENYRGGKARRQRDEAETQIDLAEKYQRALEQERWGRWDQAIRLFSTILAIKPGYKDVSGRLVKAEKKWRAQVNYETGIRFLNDGEWDQAIKNLEAVLKDDPLYKDAASKLATANRWKRLGPLYERAMTHYNLKEWDKAIKLLEKVVDGDVGFRDAAQRLHQAKLIKEGKVDKSKGEPLEETPGVISDHRGWRDIRVTIIAGAAGFLITKLIDATLKPLEPLEQVVLIVGILFILVPAYILLTQERE